MKKKPTARVPRKTTVKNQKVENGLSDALFGTGFGFNNGNCGTELSQVNTLFKNNRWYLISNMRQVLSEIYCEHGLIQTVVDVPVNDGLRGGVDVKTRQLEDSQVQDLQTALKRENDIGKVGRALKWNRLFGGAALIVVTGQPCETPLNVEALYKKPLTFRAVDMWELYGDKQNAENATGNLADEPSDFYYYYGKNLDSSRVMMMKGLEAPSFVRPRLRGWGFSVVESMVRSINQYLKANDLTFEVLDEFKVDYYKIKNLTNTLLNPTGSQRIRERIALANAGKNYQRAVVMDSEDDYLTKELTFTGISETMQGIRMQVASDLRMPLTKVFGISAAGFSSGEDDIENYNAMVESDVRQKAEFDILRVIELRCQQMFGFIPDDLAITFKPLRMLSAEQEENVKTQKHARLLSTVQSGYMTVQEFKDACNKNDLLGIQLDTSIDKLEVESTDTQQEPVAKAPVSVTQVPEAKT